MLSHNSGSQIPALQHHMQWELNPHPQIKNSHTGNVVQYNTHTHIVQYNTHTVQYNTHIVQYNTYTLYSTTHTHTHILPIHKHHMKLCDWINFKTRKRTSQLTSVSFIFLTNLNFDVNIASCL